MTEIKLHTDEAAYSRTKTTAIEHYEWCDKCGYREGTVLSIDSSEGEYGAITFCIDCLSEILADLKKADKEKPEPLVETCLYCLEEYETLNTKFNMCGDSACWNLIEQRNSDEYWIDKTIRAKELWEKFKVTKGNDKLEIARELRRLETSE